MRRFNLKLKLSCDFYIYCVRMLGELEKTLRDTFDEAKVCSWFLIY